VAGVWLDSTAALVAHRRSTALPIWTEFVRAVTGPDTPQEFPVPSGIVWRSVDPTSGALATAGCPDVRREPFLAGTEPHEPCTLHRPVLTALADEVGGVMRGGGRALDTAFRKARDWFSDLFR
jgi:membrane carboxypeptidase/penicillin-binding protein